LSPHKSSKKSKLKIALWVLSGLLIFIFFAGWIYLRINTYKADEVALKNLVSSQDIKITQSSSLIAFENVKKESELGFIVYPGGLVEPQAYSSLCRRISENFDQCFIPSMPLNFAILSPNKAEEIIKAHPEITQWTIIAHSLGGPAATRFIQSHPDVIKNLVLLGSYSDVDISNAQTKVLSLLGSQDGLVDLEVYKTSQANLPSDTVFETILGANHGQMGDYGPQKGDGEPKISAAAQKEAILQAIKNDF